MKRQVKEQILQLLITLQEAHQEMWSFFQKKEYTAFPALLSDCQEGAILIGDILEQFESNHKQVIRVLEEYCEQLFEVSVALKKPEIININEMKEVLDQYIQNIYSWVKNNVKVLKIVFFPYKASMWTSLESIWKAAEEDNECEVKVVVIPYYTLNSKGDKEELNYEAALFPDDVPIVHYKQYFVEKERPDIIFIHNPYDGGNNITRVPEQYYSYILKLYTKCLVYSPYFLMGHYSPMAGELLYNTNAAYMADKIVVQSERVKQICIEHQVDERKLLALGSPKVDAIVEGMRKAKTFPDGWKQKLGGRKVFLLNTHLSYFVRGYHYQKKYAKNSNFAEWRHEQIFRQLLNREGCALIWRPHPLLKAMLKSRDLYPLLEFVESWEQRIRDSENGVMDENGEYNTSFRVSDALITTYSSIIPEYMILGKPIYIYESPLAEEKYKESPVDYRHNYYIENPGEARTLPNFVQMILNGKDWLYEERMEDVYQAFSNLDGSIGKNIYEYLKEEQ